MQVGFTHHQQIGNPEKFVVPPSGGYCEIKCLA